MEEGKKEDKRHVGVLDLERRKYPRFKINLPLDYHRVDSSLDHAGQALNASEGGLEIYFPEKMEIGDHLMLKLFFSSESGLKTIEALAEVVWVDILSGDEEYRSGVKFINVAPEDLKMLKAFLLDLTETTAKRS